MKKLILLIFLLILSGCKPVEDGVTSTAIYPAPEPVAIYPYPSDQELIRPTLDLPPVVIPTPGADTGVVIGQSIQKETGEPLAGVTLYLAKKVPIEPGDGYILSLKRDESLHTNTDSDGLFAFGNVKPGEYVLMLWSPHDARSVIDDSTGAELEVIVTGGETLNLGQIVINWQ